MYKSTVTLFNRYRAPDGDRWYPAVLEGVDLNVDHAAMVAKYGDKTADSASLHIRYTVASNGDIVIADRRYLPPKAWENQVNDLLPGSITFAEGQEFDFFWQGEWSGEAIIKDNEYDGFYDYMNRKYDHVFAITSVAQYSVIPHFEIMGK